MAANVLALATLFPCIKKFNEQLVTRHVKAVTTVILAIVLVSTFAIQSTMAEEWVTVKSWQGETGLTTEKFTINSDSWRIATEIFPMPSSDPMLSVGFYDANGKLFRIHNFKQGGEPTYVHSSGTFYLLIGSIGDMQWKLMVQVPREMEPVTTVSDKVSLSNLQMVDPVGSRINDVSVGQPVVLQSSVKNNVAVDQKFAYIMQIKDSDGVTIMIAWINGEIPKGKTFDVGLSWIPDSVGRYKVDVFVWESVASPTPLSLKPLSMPISVT